MYHHLLYIENQGIYLSPRLGEKDVIPFDFALVKQKVIVLVKPKRRCLDFLKEGKVLEVLSQIFSILPEGQAEKVAEECLLVEIEKNRLLSEGEVSNLLRTLKSFQAGNPEEFKRFLAYSRMFPTEGTLNVETLGLGGRAKKLYTIKTLSVE